MVQFSRLHAALLSAAFALTACGGGAASPSVPAAGSSRGAGSAALSVFVPSAASTSARHRSQLPSSTQSVVIAVASASGTPLNPPVTPVIANVSATAAGCSSVSGGISCTIDVTVPFGSLLFAVVGYSGQNATGSAIAWGEATATISATGANAVNVSTSSVIEYAVMDLDGDFSLAVVDHSANTIDIVNESNSTTLAGTIAYLPNGDDKIVVTASTSGTPVGAIVYARELPGATFTFLSTNTSTPPVTGALASSADWGVGTELSPCPTTGASYLSSLATIEGPAYQSGSNLTTGQAFENGTATVSVNGGAASLGFNGNSYTINGTLVQAETGGTGTCSSGQFAANTGPNGSGIIAFDPAGVIIGSNGTSGGQLTSSTDGFAGFSVPSGSTVNLTAVTTQTYDGFFGGYTIMDSTVDKEGSPINAVPSGTNTMLSCNYSNFEAGTVATSGCATLTFGVQPQPGVVLGTFDSSATGTIPAVFVISQVSGKYVIFGVAGSLNAALIQH
jgi:hypothetical protein